MTHHTTTSRRKYGPSALGWVFIGCIAFEAALVLAVIAAVHAFA